MKPRLPSTRLPTLFLSSSSFALIVPCPALPLFVLLRSHRAVPRSSSLRPPSHLSCRAPLVLSSSSLARTSLVVVGCLGRGEGLARSLNIFTPFKPRSIKPQPRSLASLARLNIFTPSGRSSVCGQVCMYVAMYESFAWELESEGNLKSWLLT